MLHLTDLDELVQNIRNSYVKEYVTEALTAYRAGAYRAAVSTTWVAVCIDIIEKVRELSVGGDAQAKKIEEKLDAITSDNIRGMLNFENELIDVASTKLELISPVEAIQLNRLKEDRNFCVHPTFQKDGRHLNISPEAARSHIVNACNVLFIHAPTKGKVLIETLNDLVAQKSFPDDPEKAFRILSSENYLGRAKKVVIKNFLVCLLKRLLKDDDTDLNHVDLKKICAAINALHRIDYLITIDTASSHIPILLTSINDQRIVILFPVLYLSPFLVRFIDKSTRLRLLAIIPTLSGDDIAAFDIPGLADNDDEIKSVLLARFNSLNGQGQIDILTNSNSRTLKDNAIDLFLNAGSFANAYDYGKNILLPYAKHFDRNDLHKVFEGTITDKYGQILPAKGMYDVFRELYEKTKNIRSPDNSDWIAFLDRLRDTSILRQKLDALIRPSGGT